MATITTAATTPTTPATGQRSAVRRVPLPACEPPFDDECRSDAPVVASSRVTTRSAAVTQGSLALAHVLPGGLPAVPEPAASLRLVELTDDPSPTPTKRVRPGPARAGRLPDPRLWSARLAQGIAEALYGHRPIQQLIRWTDEDVYARLAGRLAGRRPVDGPRPLVRSVRICRPRDGVAEVTAIVAVPGRSRALALRLEADQSRWRCTALDFL
jgi:hypothetical protein